MHDTVLMVIVCKEETSSIPSLSIPDTSCLFTCPRAYPERNSKQAKWASHGAASPDKLLGRNICRRISSQNKTTAATRRVPRPGNYFPSGVFFVAAGSSPVRALPVLCLFIFNKFQKRSFPRKQWRLSGLALWHVCKVAGKQRHRTGQTGSPGLILSESLIHLQVLFPFAFCHLMRKSHWAVKVGWVLFVIFGKKQIVVNCFTVTSVCLSINGKRRWVGSFSPWIWDGSISIRKLSVIAHRLWYTCKCLSVWVAVTIDRCLMHDDWLMTIGALSGVLTVRNEQCRLMRNDTTLCVCVFFLCDVAVAKSEKFVC